MEFFLIEFAFRPLWHSANHIFLRHIAGDAIGPVGRMRKFVRGGKIGTNSYQEYSPAILGNAVVFCVQNLPHHAIPGKTKSAKLIFQKLPIRAVGHSIHVLNHKRLGQHEPEDTVKLAIKKVDGLARIASAPLTVTLTRVTTNKELGVGKPLKICDIASFNVWLWDIVFISLASNFRYIIRK